MSNRGAEPVTIGSLFAGIGGLELGLGWALEESGIPHRVAWQVEVEPFPRAVLARHWPEADRTVTDVCLASAANLSTVDLICGGFPCQDLSFAGKGAGIGVGTRSGLWHEYARVVRELRPRIVVVENVGALLSRGLGVVLGDLAEAGYDAEWRCVRASDVGAPHQRERLFVVAYRDRGGCQCQRGGRLLDGERSTCGSDVDGCDRERLGDTNGQRLGRGSGTRGGGIAEPADDGGEVAHAEYVGRADSTDARSGSSHPGKVRSGLFATERGAGPLGNPNLSRLEGRRGPERGIADERAPSPTGSAESPGGALNPAWVGQLMGFPDGWTDGLPVPAKRSTPGKPRGPRKA